MTERPRRPAGWLYHPSSLEVARPLDLVTDLSGSPPLSLHMVFARDGVYLPAVIRKPEGAGPWPALVVLHEGSGGLGYAFLADEMRHRGFLLERFVDEGYLVCYTEGRMESENAYERGDSQVLDHHDVIEVFRYLQRLEEVDSNRIGMFGVSHGGELQMKLIAELGEGPAALVPTEPAVVEFLSLQHEGGTPDSDDWTPEDSSGPRSEEHMQFRESVSDEQLDLESAWARITRVSAQTPILVMGRDDDHLQGLFHKLYALLQRAGKRVEWATWDHPEHAYQFGPVKENGEYRPDSIQQATLDRLVTFLNQHVRDRAP